MAIAPPAGSGGSPLARAAVGGRPPQAVTRSGVRPTLHVTVKPPVRPDGHPPVAPTPPDPYDAIISGYGQPLTPAQIQAEASGEISPMLAALTGNINTQTQAAENAIRGYSADAASKETALDLGAPFGQAEQQQAAVDAALQQSISGAGATDAQGLSSRLAILNDPSVAAAAGGLSASGTAAGNTSLASGSSSLGNLIAQAAASRSYGSQLPGIARSQGLQELGTAAQTGANNIATQTGQVEQQLPSILSGLTTANSDKVNSIQAARQNQVARNDAIVSGQAANTVKIETVNANNTTKLDIAKMNQAGKVTSEQLTQARSDRTYRLQFAKTFGYDPISGRVTPGFKVEGGNIVKVGVGGSNPGGVSPTSYAGLKTKAGKAADLFYYGQQPTTRSDGTVSKAGIPGIDYGTALKELMTQYSLKKSDALAILNTYYKPGERGRPAPPPPPPTVQPKKKGDIGITVAGPGGQTVK